MQENKGTFHEREADICLFFFKPFITIGVFVKPKLECFLLAKPVKRNLLPSAVASACIGTTVLGGKAVSQIGNNFVHKIAVHCFLLKTLPEHLL